jgi:hypothetical protein
MISEIPIELAHNFSEASKYMLIIVRYQTK